MAVEATIPLIQSLLEAMGLTAAGSAKGKKYDIPNRYSKKEQKKDMENHIKRMEAEKAMHDDPYDGLSEEEKQKLANEVNSAVEGFGGDDNNNKKPNDKIGKAAGAAAATETASKTKPDWKNMTYEERMAQANKDLFSNSKLDNDAAKKGLRQAQNRAWDKERGRTLNESEIKNFEEFRKPEPLHSNEAVDLSREKFMEGKANSLDTDKAISELKGQQKAKLRNRTVTQDSSDILEHHKAPEDTRMTNKALEGDQVKKLLGLGVGGIIGGIANALPLAGADAIEEEKEELTDFLKEIQKYINSKDPKDREIGRKMMEDYFKDRGTSIEEILKKYEEDKARETSEEPKESTEEKPVEKEPKKSKGKGLKGTDLY